ncbi:MAG: asparagine synthase (glutamine-hydrolyzing) [Gemmatimonadetes bacterium]|nr:asparagine synthase (glutamine-hydrolyzing) [Gemmatimonadota bacterium]
MCGIAGIAGAALVASQGGERAVRGMCDRIRHRGPDDDGYFTGAAVALGMRRLSIIDVAGGKQPIANEDGDVTIVFNGEIYNHRTLREGLLRRGHQYRTRSDTETIVHAYEERGDDVVHELRGMFAFAIWDDRQQRLLVARDRLGIKPLYYWETAAGLAFGSELQCISGLAGFRRDIDPRAIAWFLSLGYVPDPLCVHSGVKKLPPGHRLSWTPAGGVRVERYWTPVRAERSDLDAPTAIAELQRLITEAVDLHLESDVPLGAFLSGGLDSSTVVATMCKLARGRVRTFSIGFEEEAFNEAPQAAAVAKALGTEHTELIVRPEADQLVDGIVTAFDEPFADSSALPTYLVSKLARESVTVTLSGDGGDELFGGYTRYRSVLDRAALPAFLRAPLRALAGLLPHGVYGRNRLIDLARTRPGQYAATVAIPASSAEGGVMSRSLGAVLPGMEALLAAQFEEASSRDFVTQMTLVDMLTYLPGDILTKVDRMSMAVSLEARVPLLDHVLVEFAVSLPSRLKVRDGEGKWLLRRAAEGLVPAEALEKSKKGFSVPLGTWFRGPLRHRVESLLAPGNRLGAWVDAAAVARVTREHGAGRRDHSAVIWRLMVLDRWLSSHG